MAVFPDVWEEADIGTGWAMGAATDVEPCGMSGAMGVGAGAATGCDIAGAMCEGVPVAGATGACFIAGAVAVGVAAALGEISEYVVGFGPGTSLEAAGAGVTVGFGASPPVFPEVLTSAFGAWAFCFGR